MLLCAKGKILLKNDKTDFTQGRILPKLALFMLPILGALVLQAAYGAVDLLVVGRFGSTSGLSAVSTGSQVLNLVTFVATQLAMGVTVLIARYLGEKRPQYIGQVIGGAAIVFTLLAAALFVVLVFFARLISSLMQAPAEALDLTASYVRICGSGIFFIVAYEIAWCYYGPGSPGMRQFNRKHDNIFWYSKTHNVWKFNADAVRIPHDEKTTGNFKQGLRGSGFIAGDYSLADGKIPEDWWEMAIAGRYPNDGIKRVGYPTEKPFKLLERIITATTDPGDIVADFFMGSGVAQMCSMQMGRRFIGADINLGSIQSTTKRLLDAAKEPSSQMQEETKYTGFEVYNVNNYDFFRNPVEARDLLIQALEIQPFPQSNVWDGELDGRMVKIMPVNRIATKADLKELLANLPYATYEKRKEENPNQPVEHMTIVCMGHEPDLKGSLEQELSNYKVDVQILDVLRDKADLQLKRDSEAEIVREGNKLVIREFFPMNLMQKLSLQKEYVEEWRQLVDSVMIDWNYDGAVMQPRTIDIPEKNELVKGVYDIPEDAGTIKVKITDLLSESLEVEVR